ncbi:MAG: saccharopine dehydrogenase family protein [Oligoflexus sp.]
MTEKTFDFIIYGASGYTGRQTAAFLRKQAPDAKIGLAGRNLEKLKQVARGLSLKEDACLVADSKDVPAVQRVTAQAKVLVNTAGPFALHGEPVIQGCVEHHTDYVDITGETPFIKDMIERYHEKAQERGIRIVPFCGFDSVPSDIGTLWMIEQMKSRSWEPRMVKTFYRIKGGFNGGTIASALNMAETGNNRQLVNPLLLVPKPQRNDDDRRRSKEPQKPVFDPDLNIWSAPFFMAPINSAVVRRSRAIYQQWQQDYGKEFEYHERLCVDRNGKWLASAIASLASAAFVTATLSSPGRQLVRKLAPAPGEGPSDEDMDSGYMRCQIVGKSWRNDMLQGVIKAKGDPGNRITVKILGESAKHLLTAPRDKLPGGAKFGGILTPATGLGLDLIPKLEEQGIHFSLEQD